LSSHLSPRVHAPAIPSARLDNASTWEAVLPQLKALVLRGDFILGEALKEFEGAAAAAFGCRWAVGTSSGTSALILALRAAGLPEEARVALPANTFYAVFEAVLSAGHVPVIVDHDENYLIDLAALDDIEVRAVVPVHLYGLPVDMEELSIEARRRGWWVLEDCSQAHGATIGGRPVGAFGDAAAFSAYPTKNLGAWGDAGFVTGSDPALAESVRALRHHAQRTSNVHEGVGGTDRLDTLQALVLQEKLRRLPEEVRARRQVAEWYREALEGSGLDLPEDLGRRTHAFHQFVVRVPDRDQVRTRLADRGIGTAVHYPTPIHLQPGAQGRADVPRRPARAESWASTLLSLPMYPGLTEGEVARVAESLREAINAR
jgi:dTDP-4-amino-4,6-dideoxygalactose transaminase